jgi:hypothetical protein
MRLALLLVAVAFACVAPARADVVDDAFLSAFETFEAAHRGLGAALFDVDTAAYRDALSLQTYSSPFWGEALRLDIVRGAAEGACAQFAAYVSLPPQAGAVPLVVCPQFVNSGTPALRTLTVLHEVVHAVAGPDECRAMAFAAHVEQRATGRFTPVDRYWQANNCDASRFSLP